MKTSVPAVLTAAGVAVAALCSSAWAGPSHVSRTCAPSKTTLFCEDFESLPNGGASSANWGIGSRHGTLTVEPVSRASAGARGRKVLHAPTTR